MLVTRGLGGYALVTAGLGDLGSYVEGIEWDSPASWHIRQYEAGIYRTRPLFASQRIAAHNKIKARERGYRRTGG